MASHWLSERSFSIGQFQSKIASHPGGRGAPHLAIRLEPANQKIKTEYFEQRGHHALYHDAEHFQFGGAATVGVSGGGSVIGAMPVS